MTRLTTKDRPVWVDGGMVAWPEARVGILSHAMQRGSLVFDVGALRPTVGDGAALFCAREHIERFLRSAALVGLEVTWDVDALLSATAETSRMSGVSSALVRWSAFVATVEADVVPRVPARATVAIAVITPEDTGVSGEPSPPKPPAVRVAIPRDARKAGPEVMPPQAKVAASYLGPMLAKRRARADGHDEVVLLDGEGRIAEAPTANVFLVRNGTLLTPPTERVLAGVTRACVLEIAKAEGIPTRVEHLVPDDFADADEAFLTGTSLPVQAIAAVDGSPLRAPAPGPVTVRLKDALLACERGADARFVRWLHAVR